MQGKVGTRSVGSLHHNARGSGESAHIGKHTLVEPQSDLGDGVSVDAGGSASHSPSGPVQRQAAGRASLQGAAPADIASQGTSGSGEPLPYLDRIQACFGRHDLSGVKAHQGAAAGEASRALGAQAFAFGNAVGYRSPPDLHTAAHEAAHIIQQRGGQQRGGVHLKGGIDQPGDAYERHADVVVAGRSAQPLLDQVASATGRAPALQRKATNATTTPGGLPDPAPPDSIAPPANESHLDAEGNKIVEDGGHWHLAERPKALGFPIASSYKYQLLSINPNLAYTVLRTRVAAIQAEQLAYAHALKGDMKYWFAKVYYFVTTHELKAIDAGEYQYPHMKMQEVTQFHAAYKTNLDAWRDGNKDKVEAHWKKAFAAAESEQGGTWYKPRSMELMHMLLPSMQAHIRFDLPRAIATCFVQHYAGIPGTGMSDFKADFDAMGPVFDQAQASLLSEVKDDSWIIDPGRYSPVQDVGFPFIFNVPSERERTFEKATRLATGMRKGEANAEYLKAMRANTRVAHPNSGSDDFSVDGTDVGSQFDWMHQPGARPDPAAPAPAYEAAVAPPPFPAKLFFKQGRGQSDDKLEEAIRDDQDLAPFKALAEWTRKVRGAEIHLEGHASAEGEDYDNANLANSRAFLVKFFMWHCGADTELNRFVEVGMGEAGASSTPEWRFVTVRVTQRGTSRQQHNAINPNLPSEVSK